MEPLIEKLKTAIREMTAKYYDMRDSYYSLSGRIGKLRNENEYLERTNLDLRQEIAVLKEDLKDFRTIKKAFGTRRTDDLISEAREVIRQRGRQWER